MRALDVLEGMGDRSAGFTGVDRTSRPYLRMEMAFVRRGRALLMLMVGYVDGAEPRVDILKLAQALDGRLSAALASEGGD